MISQYLDVGFIVSIILGTYLIVKELETILKKPLKSIYKKSITYITGIVMFIVWKCIGDKEVVTLLTSYIFSTALYDYILKAILIKFGKAYKHLKEHESLSSTGED